MKLVEDLGLVLETVLGSGMVSATLLSWVLRIGLVESSGSMLEMESAEPLVWLSGMK